MIEWCFDNYGTIVKLNVEASEYLNFCCNNRSCSLIDSRLMEMEYGSVYHIDFLVMVMWNEKSLAPFGLKRGEPTMKDGTMYIDNVKVDSIIPEPIFVPYCNHTQLYNGDIDIVIYPNLRTIVIPMKSCQHETGCHVRTCKHNKELLYRTNSNHDYSKIPELIKKEDLEHKYYK